MISGAYSPTLWEVTGTINTLSCSQLVLLKSLTKQIKNRHIHLHTVIL